MMKSNIFNDTESVEVAANLARNAETGDDQGLEDIDIDYGSDDNVTTSTKTPRSSTSTKVMGCMFLGGVACGATAGFAYGGVEANKAGMIQSRMSTVACSKAPKGTKSPKSTKGPKSSGSPGPVNPCDGMVGHMYKNWDSSMWFEIISAEPAMHMADVGLMCPFKASVTTSSLNSGAPFDVASMLIVKQNFMSAQGVVDGSVFAGGIEMKKNTMVYNFALTEASDNTYVNYMYGWLDRARN